MMLSLSRFTHNLAILYRAGLPILQAMKLCQGLVGNAVVENAVAEIEEDMKALLLGAAAMNSEALSLLLPVRQASLFRWCLSQGYRAVMPMTLMALGEYREPNGCYIPSVLY